MNCDDTRSPKSMFRHLLCAHICAIPLRVGDLRSLGLNMSCVHTYVIPSYIMIPAPGFVDIIF